MMKNSGQLLKGIMSYIALQHNFCEKNPSERRILFANHDIGYESAERGLPRYPLP